MNRAEVLKKAEACVMVDRQSTHGKPEDSFGLIAKFWSSYLGIEVKDYQVAVMMGLLKIARLKLCPQNEDSYVDLAGYAACGAELAPQPEHAPSFWKGVGDPIIDENGRFKHGLGQTRRTIDSPAPLPSSALQELEAYTS